MKVVILCGGRGTRLGDVAENKPKPMVPIGPRPLLWHLMRYYAHWGHNEFVLCLGHKGEIIKDYFVNYKMRTTDLTVTLGRESKIDYHGPDADTPWRVTLADTGDNAMTGARIKRIQKYVAGEKNFFLTYGDGLSDVNLKALLAAHESHGKIMTLCGVHPTGRFGEILSDNRGRVIEFHEKPKSGGGRVSGGFFVCRQELFNYLEDRDDLVFELGPMSRLARDGQLMVFEHDGFWQPMDTPREFAALNALLDEGKAPWMIWR
ncbi:MAG: glucose-1-phosphate cytidylyltransferase [Elusimicrobia bacterium]|nr:glucose-1-phosphate cytidylyltransferase [Elusimicrobiota bacterium]